MSKVAKIFTAAGITTVALSVGVVLAAYRRKNQPICYISVGKHTK